MTDPSRPLSSSRLRKLGAVLTVLVLLALAYHFGVLERFSAPAEIARTLVSLGGWGYLMFIVAYALLQPFGVPGTVFVVAAPLIWPWPVAFALSMTGTMAASVIGFSFARFVARDWVARAVPDRFRKYDAGLAARGFSTVFALRFVFWMPQWLHVLLGVSTVPFWTHFWASLLGYAIPLFLLSFFGQKLFDYMKHASPSTWLLVLLASAIVLSGVWLAQRHTRRRNLRSDS
jgi:uncharacterized membrane protein YdjX (TVP38/TMEM64 family)